MAFAPTPGYNGFWSFGSTYSTASSSMDTDYSAAMLDVTVFGDTAHTRIAGLKDGSFKPDMKYSPTEAAALQALVGTSGTLILGPAGNVATNVRCTVTAFLAKISYKTSVSGVAEMTPEFQFSGTAVWDTF